MNKHARVLGAILAAVTAGAPGAEAVARTHAVRITEQAAAGIAALSLKPIRQFGYRSFQWLQLSEADYTRLAASGIPFEPDPDAGEVRVAGFHFDPLTDGEPVVAGRLAASGSGPRFRLVQLAGPVTDAWLGALSASGARVLQYYPHNTYLVWADGTQSAALASFDFVRWEGAFHPAYKIDPSLGGRSGLIANVDVMFFDDGDVPSTLGLIAAAGGEVIQHYPAQPDLAFRNAIVRLPASAIEAVARLDNVLWLGYQSPVPQLDDEMSSQIVAGNYSGAPPAPFTGYASWLSTVGLDGAAVRWATIDTGVDYQHPDLATHIAGGYSFPGACAPAGEPGSDCSGGGHGTHVTGIIGGNAAGAFGDPLGFKYGFGIAPSYEIFAMNSLSGAAWPPTGGWQEHSKRAVLGNAIGGNNSWTTSEGVSTGYIASCRTHDLMVRDGNFDTATVAEAFIEVFSAGNSGPSPSTLTSPKEAKNLIVVASSLNFRVGSIDSISNFSSRGPAVDGRWVPTVAAPGSTIASSRNDLGGSCSSPIGGTNNLYAFCSGTSMAAPHVSGAIVLATEWWRGFNAGANPSPAMAKALLVNTAVDMNEPAPIPIPNIHEGWGRVHLGNLFAAGATRFYRDQQDVFANAGESRVYAIRVADTSRPLKVTLAWSDAPGAPGANPALVNNLDLTVVNGANTYRGNNFSAGWSTTGGAPDTRNNLENVYVQSPSALATITITAINLPGDGIPYNADVTDQDFALVCSNCSIAALVPAALSVDASGNGVWEPGESAVIAPAWLNSSQQIVGPVTGVIASTAPITITDAGAAYGFIAPSATVSCTAGANCYAAAATGPRPGPHWDAVVDETLTPNVTHAWRIHVGGSFADVPVSNVRYRFVETVLHKDVTAGCNSTSYCPDSATTREQMAVFVLVSKEGSSYLPPACGATPMFDDVPASSPFCRWIEELARRGVVGGCGGGSYCPTAAVNRAQMPIFVLRTKEGGAYLPPACGAIPMFDDVPASSPFCRWIEEFARRGITTGCGGGNYCPLQPVTRGQMAVFLTVGFSLVLYGP